MVDDASLSSPNQGSKLDNPEAKPDSERAAMLTKLREMIQTRRKPRKNWSNYCAKCNVFFRRKESLRLHLRLHEKDAANLQLFKCAACEQQFDDIRTLKHHVDYINCSPRLKPEVEVREPSEFVYVGQKRKQKWISRPPNEMNKPRRMKLCNKCGKFYVVVNNQKDSGYCPQCSLKNRSSSAESESTTATTSTEHATVARTEEDQSNSCHAIHKCLLCQSSFLNATAFDAHMTTAHSAYFKHERLRNLPTCHNVKTQKQARSEGQHWCEECNVMFHSNDDFLNHKDLNACDPTMPLPTIPLTQCDDEDANVDQTCVEFDSTKSSDSSNSAESSDFNVLDSMKCIKQEPSDPAVFPTELIGMVKTEPQSTTNTSSEELIHTCHKCGMSFVEFSQLEAHSTSSQCDRNDAVQPQQLHVCKKCGTCFDDFWQLNSHRVQTQSQCNAPGFGKSQRLQPEKPIYSNQTTEIKVDHLYNRGVNQSSNSNVASATISVKKAKKRRKRNSAKTEVIEVEQIY